MAEQIIFYILALIMVVFSIMAVTSKRIIRAAVYLLFVLLSTAFIYLLLNYHFLFAVQIAVYAGGIMVLFIMAIFLTHQPGKKIKVQRKSRAIPALLLSIAGIAISGFIIVKNVNSVYQLVTGDEINMQEIGTTLMGYEKYQYVLPFEVVSVLLLACIIGAILIARPEPNEEKQLQENKAKGE
ncbi:MAG: NADH-quinone oxidoreductase subunit J [Paludibacteraceae bacterium]